jgi:hypothetical protein
VSSRSLPLPVLARGERGAERAKPARKRANRLDRIARDLSDELKAPRNQKKDKARWSRDVDGVHMVQLLVSSDSADPQMTTLRAEVVRQGGKVQVVHRNLQTLTVLLPATKVAALSQHDDVLRIIPNRDTRSTASAIETITGANTSAVRTYTATTAYTGLDGTGASPSSTPA